MIKYLVMLIWSEQLADYLDDGNARRGWWLNLVEEQKPVNPEWCEVLEQALRAAA